jgi:monoamine oxidase
MARGAASGVLDRNATAATKSFQPSWPPSWLSRISRCSHTLANCQSRITVSGETLTTDAVSSTVRPPKNRSSITRLLRWSNLASASRASSSATRLQQTHFVGKPLDAELAALRGISFADFVQRDALPRKVSEWIRVTVEPEMAIEWDQIAALDGIDEMRLFLDSPDGFGEKNYHVSGGNTRFVQALVSRVGSGRIRLESQVTAIERLPDGIRVRYLERGATYRELQAAAVVVTVPLYALNRIQFIPPLSDERRKAIDTTRFGAYIKVHLRVAAAAAPLWETKGETLLTMLTDSPAGSVYEATGFQAHSPTADRYLTMLIHAPFARQMLEMNADDMRAHAIRGLDAMFPGIARHVELAEIFSYPTAVAYWPLSLGRSRFDDLAATLRTPEGGIWIGGDTTENSHSEGSVQAALRMAAQVAAAVKRTR